MEATLKTLDVKKTTQEEVRKKKESIEEEEDSYEYMLKKKQVEKFRECLQDKVMFKGSEE